MEKCRVIAMTDIQPYDREPDDAGSLIRLMLYSNEYDLEGIISTASHAALDISDEGFYQRMMRAVKAYEEVYPDLCKHAEGYPDPVELAKKVKRGIPKVHMRDFDLHLTEEEEKLHDWKDIGTMNLCMLKQKHILAGDYEYGEFHIGKGLSCEGSELIRKALLKDDKRPIWFLCWTGCGSLAQALYDIRDTMSHEETVRLSKKVYVYDIDGQDDCGAWICKNFPDVTWLRSDSQFYGMTQDEDGSVMAEQTYVNEEFLKKYVYDYGPLGCAYPPQITTTESDSPSILYVIQNGLNDPFHQNWGGWGGRFTADRSKNPPSAQYGADFIAEEYPFWAYRDDVDTYQNPETGKLYINSIFQPIGRWRKDYQYDMAVRMQWSMNPEYSECNHNPVAILNGDKTKNILIQKVEPGEKVILDASESYDPDGDDITFRWYVYKEPGTYKKEIVILNADMAKAELQVPGDAENEEIHVILEVRDNGKLLPLKAYRRIILRTGQGGYVLSKPYTVNDSDQNPSALGRFEYKGIWEHRTEVYGSNNYDTHTSDCEGNVAILHFTGRQVKLFDVPLNNCGKMAVSVDGGEEAVVDCYSQLRPWKSRRNIEFYPTAGETLCYCSKVLPYGEHELQIRVLGKKNDVSAGCFVHIDKAEVFI